jgi:hypothetical protein
MSKNIPLDPSGLPPSKGEFRGLRRVVYSGRRSLALTNWGCVNEFEFEQQYEHEYENEYEEEYDPQFEYESL